MYSGVITKDFMKKLAENIILCRNDETNEQLEELERRSGGKEMLDKYREEDETLLHLATKYHDDGIIVEKLVSLCPSLLTMTRTGVYEGQTALHIAITKQNYDAVEVMVRNPEKRHLLSIPATGSRFIYTIMMGELPLSVAAMTFNNDIVEELINYGAKMALQNSYGDTVFHSLVKYSSLHPDQQEMVIDIMGTINSKLAKRSCEKIEALENFVYEETDPVAVWFYPNYEKLTPLQLAGKLGQTEIFNYILNLEDVYCRLDRHDGLFDIKLYDVTEIDSVAMQYWHKNNHEKKTTSKPFQQNVNSDLHNKEINKNRTRFNLLNEVKEIQGVLERISKLQVEQAFAFLHFLVIKNIIKDKWSRYKWYYYSWAIFHVIYMIGITWYAITRTKLRTYLTSMGNQSPSQMSQIEKICVRAVSYLNFIIPLLYLLIEVKNLCERQYWNLTKIHHNGTYRLLLVLFSLATLADAAWYLIQPGYNYFLILSVLIGWWFVTFFLRAFKKFSFFTVMMQKVLFSDLIRFSIIILLELLSFTAMIYMLFVPTNIQCNNSDNCNSSENFQSFEMALLTLFNLMLGLSDISVLNEASEPWLAIGLFVVFALLTYILMINALIAMMSQTCAIISSNKHTQWQMQRLSVILFIENSVFSFMKKCSGKPKFVKHFDIKQKTMIQEERYFLELDSLQTSYSKGSAILSRKNLVQTGRFDDVHAYETQLPSGNQMHKKRTPQKHIDKMNPTVKNYEPTVDENIPETSLDISENVQMPSKQMHFKEQVMMPKQYAKVFVNSTTQTDNVDILSGNSAAIERDNQISYTQLETRGFSKEKRRKPSHRKRQSRVSPISDVPTSCSDQTDAVFSEPVSSTQAEGKAIICDYSENQPKISEKTFGKYDISVIYVSNTEG